MCVSCCLWKHYPRLIRYWEAKLKLLKKWTQNLFEWLTSLTWLHISSLWYFLSHFENLLLTLQVMYILNSLIYTYPLNYLFPILFHARRYSQKILANDPLPAKLQIQNYGSHLLHIFKKPDIWSKYKVFWYNCKTQISIENKLRFSNLKFKLFNAIYTKKLSFAIVKLNFFIKHFKSYIFIAKGQKD